MNQSGSKTTRSKLGGILVGGGSPVRIAGIVNVSPASFYESSILSTKDEIKRAVERMAKEGADLLDVSARSNAPYVQLDMSADEEAERMCRAIEVVRQVTDLPVMADTQIASVALESHKAGADILNDASGLAYDTMMPEVARLYDGLVLVANADFANLLGDPVTVVKQSLRTALQRAKQAGIPPGKVALDPGIGYFRNRDISWDEWDRTILRNLASFKDLHAPLALNLSRKSFMGKALGYEDPADRLYGSVGMTSLVVAAGAHMLRTHDVAATRDAARIARWFSGGKL